VRSLGCTALAKSREVDVAFLAVVESKFQGSHQHFRIARLQSNILANMLFQLTPTTVFLLVPLDKVIIVPNIFYPSCISVVERCRFILPELLLF
jgi:hypothetical protein